MTKKNFDEIVKNSQDISNKWRQVPAPQRGEYIRLFGEELRQKKKELAETITKEARKIKTESNGTGPVDAVCKAIDKIISFTSKLTEFSVNSVTEGIDALGEVTIRVENKKGRTFTGIGSDSDIVVASAKAYLNAINRQLKMMNEGSESPVSGAGR